MSDDIAGRLRIGESVQADGPHMEGVEIDSILTGWVVVAEWMASDGNTWLSKNSSDASGEHLSSWRMNGMLFEALHTEWEGRDA